MFLFVDMRLQSIFKSDVFPAPEAPIIAVNSPALHIPFMFLRIWRVIDFYSPDGISLLLF
jgi:hypothetical protein